MGQIAKSLSNLYKKYPQRHVECISICVKKGRTPARLRNTQHNPPNICAHGGLRGISETQCVSEGVYCAKLTLSHQAESLCRDDSAGLAYVCLFIILKFLIFIPSPNNVGLWPSIILKVCI